MVVNDFFSIVLLSCCLIALGTGFAYSLIAGWQIIEPG
jgi:hypothetical protein